MDLSTGNVLSRQIPDLDATKPIAFATRECAAAGPPGTCRTLVAVLHRGTLTILTGDENSQPLRVSFPLWSAEAGGLWVAFTAGEEEDGSFDLLLSTGGGLHSCVTISVDASCRPVYSAKLSAHFPSVKRMSVSDDGTWIRLESDDLIASTPAACLRRAVRRADVSDPLEALKLDAEDS